ncbi:MAG: MerR family transcriptional regulator [Dehalococcoidales bacterium]|nr:MerR family transcriptional regulator [Dehalococcoidales bacterium]
MGDEQFVIGELARRTGYSTGMIRHLEKMGVITPPVRTAVGYRLFGPHHVQELRFVRDMQDLGFYAQQIKMLREIKLGESPIIEKQEAIEEIFQEHARYVEDKVTYFTNLKNRLSVVAPDFVDNILISDC